MCLACKCAHAHACARASVTVPPPPDMLPLVPDLGRGLWETCFAGLPILQSVGLSWGPWAQACVGQPMSVVPEKVFLGKMWVIHGGEGANCCQV